MATRKKKGKTKKPTKAAPYKPQPIVIERGVQPPDRPGIRAAIHAMKVGDMFEQPEKHWATMRNGASNVPKMKKGKGKKFTVHKYKDRPMVGIWRLA